MIGDRRSGTVGNNVNRRKFFAGLLGATACTATSLPARSNVFEDNPDIVLDRSLETQFSPIGELEGLQTSSDTSGNVYVSRGTAVLISPSYILTNYHVAFDGNKPPAPGTDYSMRFRAGVGKAAPFEGNTIATVVPGLIGIMGIGDRSGDWAVMKLKTPVGGRPEFGWFDAASFNAHDLFGKKVAAVGYAGQNARGGLSYCEGMVTGYEKFLGLLKLSASSSPGESGGGVFIIEAGQIKLCGIIQGEFGLAEGNNTSNRVKSYSDSRYNCFISTFEILNRSDIKALLDADKDTVGANSRAKTTCFLQAQTNCISYSPVNHSRVSL